MNHLASAIDKAYISESTKISLERIFVDFSEVEGLEESELLVVYNVFT